jgi:hypothetical protein
VKQSSYNSTPTITDTITTPNIPKPALLTPRAAAPVLPPALPPALPVGLPVGLPLAPVTLTELDDGVAVAVAVAVLLPLQKMLLGLTPPSMKHFCRSATDCWTERQ